MAKLAYKDMLKDDEIELFIRTYCTFRDGWRLERGRSPDPLWADLNGVPIAKPREFC